jgi:hypothetical protein
MPVRRGIELTQESLDNWKLAKCHTKPKSSRWQHSPNRRGFREVTSEEVLKEILNSGIKRDVRTLQRYAKKGLIPKPTIQYLGRGKGKTADWPESTPSEFFASWKLINALGLKEDLVVNGRKLALLQEKSTAGNLNCRIHDCLEKEPVFEKMNSNDKGILNGIVIYWLSLKDKEIGKTVSNFLFNDDPSIIFKDGEMDRYRP